MERFPFGYKSGQLKYKRAIELVQQLHAGFSLLAYSQRPICANRCSERRPKSSDPVRTSSFAAKFWWFDQEMHCSS